MLNLQQALDDALADHLKTLFNVLCANLVAGSPDAHVAFANGLDLALRAYQLARTQIEWRK